MPPCAAKKALFCDLSKTTGTGEALAYLPKLGSATLETVPLTGYRWNLTEEGKASRTIYIPNTDLDDVEHHGRNYGCVIKYKHSKDYLFGVFMSAHYNGQQSTVTFMECHCEAIEQDGQIIYPFSNLPADAPIAAFEQYFTIKTVPYRDLEHKSCKFLNLLSGLPCVPLQIGNIIANLDHQDKCIQMDPYGPDKVFTTVIPRNENEPVKTDYSKAYVVPTVEDSKPEAQPAKKRRYCLGKHTKQFRDARCTTPNAGKFGLLTKTQFNMLKEERRIAKMHNKWVRKLTKDNIIELQMVDVTEEFPGGVRIILGNDRKKAANDKTCEAGDVNLDETPDIHFEEHNIRPTSIPPDGVKVVEWGRLKNAFTQLDPQLYGLIDFTYGNIIFEHQYYRQEWHDFFVPICNAAVNALEHVTVAAAFALDEGVNEFLQAALVGSKQLQELGHNSIKILTTGYLTKWLSFANTSHVDQNDKLLPVFQARADEVLEEWQRDPSKHDIYLYLMEMREMFTVVNKKGEQTFSVPTHCAYAVSGVFPASWIIYQYFLNDGIGIAVRFKEGWTQQFYGAEIAHNTAVTVAVDPDTGLVHYFDDNATIIAWGAGGSYREWIVPEET
ncbi:hypothetical protein MPSEU_001007800 [Mayamaea pseudoterrestris]|nr:hypothetical protein MPSEU_001007700 [Mayamaea pseudoterrestris]GKZ00554.1 hypothetical protein MPSEU_001007800 [Mayamaea pseudoterrestris]